MKTTRIMLLIIIVSGCGACWDLAEADGVDAYNIGLVIERTKESIRLKKGVERRQLQNTEIIRGQDLEQAVKDRMIRTDEAIQMMKARMSNQSAPQQYKDIARMRMMMMKETIRRNKMQQDLNRRFMQDRLRQIKEQTGVIQQRLKDNQQRLKDTQQRFKDTQQRFKDNDE